jgi:hypothetical protein
MLSSYNLYYSSNFNKTINNNVKLYLNKENLFRYATKKNDHELKFNEVLINAYTFP